MGDKTKIEWANSSWNPITGCFHPCEYCYARKMAYRFTKSGMNQENYNAFVKIFGHDYKNDIHVLNTPIYDPNGERDPYPYGFEPTFHRYRLDDYKNKKGRTIFVCSMADLFGDWVPDEWIQEVFAACKAAPQHRYLFLTKNPKRYQALYDSKILPYKDNYWFGTTCTTPNDKFTWFKDTPYKSFISMEPLLAPFGDLENGEIPDWVIIGAETGNRKDKVIPKREWIIDIVVDCKNQGIPVFMKESLRGIMGNGFIQEFPWINEVLE